MAIKLHAAYSKKAGLPGYSSHQFSVSIETELQNLDNVATESARLYESLQAVVDRQLQQTGFVPPDGYGLNGSTPVNGHSENGEWQCSGKQRELIERIVHENNLDKGEVDQLSTELFGHGVKSLNRLAASGLIDQLIERYGRKVQRDGRDRRNLARSNDRAR